MAIVMKLCGDALGRPTPYDGQYLRAFDFEAHGGQGEGDFTPDLTKAKRFPSMIEAHEFYKTVPACRPLRPDLKPNRPLTSTNWEFVTVEDAA